MENCIFCQIITGEIPSAKVFESEQILAFLDINPVNPGHTLVIPKQHVENFTTVSETQLKHLMPVVQKVALAVQKATNAGGFNLVVNNFKAAGQLVDHLHIHIIPRHDNDGYQHWHGQKYANKDLMGQTQEAIISQLSDNL